VRRPRLSADAYRTITLVAVVLLAIIIVTGAAVRLTGSGLGCPDWPTCGSFVARHQTGYHQAIEQINRYFTGLVSVAVMVCVLGSLVRVQRRRDLLWLSLGLVAGVFAQAVLGGLVVLFKLRPELVMAHFLVSLVLLTDALVLHHRAGQPDGAASELVVVPALRSIGRALLLSAFAVVVAGTVVTSTGPHGGDKHAKRFNFYLPEVARVHGILVMVFLALVLATLWWSWRTRAPWAVQQRVGLLLVVVVAQAVIGYIQYFNGIPELLVGVHVAGAVAVWTAVVVFYLDLTRPAPVAETAEIVPVSTPA
jgi:cytochrome c oxidase assembly protein subunit 15